jgi:hypothetical protein
MNRVFLTTAAVLLLASVTKAEPVSLTVSPVVIASPNGHSRLLVSVSSLAAYREEWVSSATLVLDLGPGSLPSRVELQVDAVATPWSGGATWTSPWIRPGGDVVGQTGGGASLAAGPAPGRLRVDVTHAIRGMAEGDLQENGLIVYPSDPGTPGFTAAEMQVLGVSSATLEVHVRSLTARGYRGGTKALLDRKRESRLAETSRG